jgi:hypothetical protein
MSKNIDREPPMVINLSVVEEKRKLMSHIGTLQGLYEVRLKPRKRTRSLDQNAYYWTAFVGPWTEWLRREYSDPSITTEQAHITLKCAVLDPRTKVNEETGQALELVPTTHDMDTAQFSIYLDLAAKFLAEFCQIVVLESEMFAETK